VTKSRRRYDATKDARAERSRAAALAAARELLLSEGLAAMTHARVAEVAGLHRATVYRHWPSMVPLLLDVTRHETAVTIPAPTGDLRHDLNAGLRGVRDDLVDRGFGRFLAALIDQAERDEALHAAKVSIVAVGLGAIRVALCQAIERGELPSDLDIDAGVSQLFGPILYRRLLSAEQIPDGYIEQLVDAYLAAHRSGDIDSAGNQQFRS
jgi:AcrR family transcriptional regulator